MKYSYKTKGTCSRSIELDIDDKGLINRVDFIGGCDGNLQAVSKLVKGMPVEEVIDKLEGMCCGNRPTSCPDQLCKALHEMGY